MFTDTSLKPGPLFFVCVFDPVFPTAQKVSLLFPILKFNYFKIFG